MRQTSMWLRGAGREPRPLPHPAPTPPAAAGPAAGRWGRPAGCRRAGRGRRRAGAGRPASHPGWPCRRGRRQGRSGRARALQILAAANERRSRRGRRPPPGRLTCLSVGPAPVLTTPGRCSIWARELSLAGSRELMAEPRGPSSGDQLSAPVTTCQPRCMAGLGAAVGWLGGLGCVGRTGKEWPGGQRSGRWRAGEAAAAGCGAGPFRRARADSGRLRALPHLGTRPWGGSGACRPGGAPAAASPELAGCRPGAAGV